MLDPSRTRVFPRSWILSLATLLVLACGDEARPPARSLFILGDSYAVFSAHYLIPLARREGCDVPIANVSRSGWTAAEALASETQWRPALETAVAPVLVTTIFGFNDLMSPRSRRTPEQAAGDVTALLDRVRLVVSPSGGRVLQLTYDDVWALPPHPVFFDGAPREWDATPSALLTRYYAHLPRAADDYRLLDVRGWLGEALWTADGIHMKPENYAQQARLLWERELRERLACGSRARP